MVSSSTIIGVIMCIIGYVLTNINSRPNSHVGAYAAIMGGALLLGGVLIVLRETYEVMVRITG